MEHFSTVDKELFENYLEQFVAVDRTQKMEDLHHQYLTVLYQLLLVLVHHQWIEKNWNQSLDSLVIFLVSVNFESLANEFGLEGSDGWVNSVNTLQQLESLVPVPVGKHRNIFNQWDDRANIRYQIFIRCSLNLVWLSQISESFETAFHDFLWLVLF